MRCLLWWYRYGHNGGHNGGHDGHNGPAGELLAAHLKNATAIAHAAAPGKPLWIWDDMFNPFHNAHAEYVLY